MTPKEKAKELFEKCYDAIPSNDMGLNDDASEKCALIAVDEILKSFDAFMDSRKNFRHELEIDAEKYWQEVKQEIKNL